jgi:hypothetical protein
MLQALAEIDAFQRRYAHLVDMRPMLQAALEFRQAMQQLALPARCGTEIVAVRPIRENSRRTGKCIAMVGGNPEFANHRMHSQFVPKVVWDEISDAPIGYFRAEHHGGETGGVWLIGERVEKPAVW